MFVITPWKKRRNLGRRAVAEVGGGVVKGGVGPTRAVDPAPNGAHLGREWGEDPNRVGDEESGSGRAKEGGDWRRTGDGRGGRGE